MDFRPKRLVNKPNIPLELSDKSTECESPSPRLRQESPNRVVNTEFEKMRGNIKSLLFSKIKSASFHDISETDSQSNSSPSNTHETGSLRSLGPGKVPHKGSFESNNNLEVYRQRVKVSLFGNHTQKQKDLNTSLSLSKSEENKPQPQEALKISLKDESPVSGQSNNCEQGNEPYSKDTSPENNILEKIETFAIEECTANEDDSDSPQPAKDNKCLMQPIFLVDVDREIKHLKEELRIHENSNIHIINGNFGLHYQMGQILGEGTSGTVKKCIRNDNGASYAVKIVNYKNDMEMLVLIVKEFKNHHKLSHKNIIKVYELYIDVFTRKIYTIMELTEGKEMFEVIINMGHYSEAIASGIFMQILAGINYLHKNGVCHRDLKPNNILVSKDGKIVKITDFNVSKFVENKSKKYSSLSTSNYKMWTYTGTIAFTAPEVFQDVEYTEAVDMWSAGTVLYTMLCGYQPFQAEFTKDLIELIKGAKYDFHAESWGTISEQAKDLVRKCLDPNFKTRFLPAQALMHPWIANRGKVPDTSIVKAKDYLAFSAIQTRPRGESSSKLSLQASPFLWEHKGRSSLPRRMSLASSPFDFEFAKKSKEEKPYAKRPAKFIMPFNKEFVELNPDEEDSSPELKNTKSKNSALGSDLSKNEEVWELKIENNEEIKGEVLELENESTEMENSEAKKDLFAKLLLLCRENSEGSKFQ